MITRKLVEAENRKWKFENSSRSICGLKTFCSRFFFTPSSEELRERQQKNLQGLKPIFAALSDVGAKAPTPNRPAKSEIRLAFTSSTRSRTVLRKRRRSSLIFLKDGLRKF